MKALDIYNLLEHTYSINDFRISYKSEFDEYSKLLKKIGSTISIKIKEDFEFVFGQQHLITISEFYLCNELSEIEINYLVDCILLSENIQIVDEKLHEMLETFTDSEINGVLTTDYVVQIISFLNNTKSSS